MDWPNRYSQYNKIQFKRSNGKSALSEDDRTILNSINNNSTIAQLLSQSPKHGSTGS